MFGHRWTSSYGETDKNDTWRRCLAGVMPENLARGLRACAELDTKGGDIWPPNAPEFRRMCFGEKRRPSAETMEMSRALPEPEELKELRKEVARAHFAKWREMGLMRK